MKDQQVFISKEQNGEIRVSSGSDRRFVHVSSLTPDKKVEAVKEAVLALGLVWSEDMEGKVLQELFGRR